MPTPEELRTRFWKALEADQTMMLGLAGVEESHTRPMTAQLLDNQNPIFFFTTSDNTLVPHALRGHRAIATFASKGHDLFASVHGDLAVDNDQQTIDRLWNSHAAAWYERGRRDPKLTLLRFDADRAEIWLDASSMLAGIKILLGADPKREFRDNVAKVNLR